MRISDWSSDVCSSDLGYHPKAAPGDDYGPAIAVNGVIPDWLRDTDVGLFENTPDNWLGGDGKTLLWWVWGGKGHCPISIRLPADHRSEEHTSELQSLMRNSYAVFCLKTKKQVAQHTRQQMYKATY